MNPSARAAYMDASVATATPARLLVMLCERLALDVGRGLDAQRAGDHSATNRHLVHAQDIVMELRTSLDTAAWDGGPALASIYDFLHLQLVRANVTKDPAVTEGCLSLATELVSTWREAALSAASVA